MRTLWVLGLDCLFAPNEIRRMAILADAFCIEFMVTTGQKGRHLEQLALKQKARKRAFFCIELTVNISFLSRTGVATRIEAESQEKGDSQTDIHCPVRLADKPCLKVLLVDLS